MYSFVPFSLVHYFAVLVGKSLTEVRIIRRRVIGPTTTRNPFPNIGPGSFLSLPVMIPAIVQYLFGEVWNPRLPVRLVRSRSFGPICSGLVGVQFPFKICLGVRLPLSRFGLIRIGGGFVCGRCETMFPLMLRSSLVANISTDRGYFSTAVLLVQAEPGPLRVPLRSVALRSGLRLTCRPPLAAVAFVPVCPSNEHSEPVIE